MRKPFFSLDSLVRPMSCGTFRASIMPPISFSSCPLFTPYGIDLTMICGFFGWSSNYHSPCTLDRAVARLVDASQRRPVGDDLAAQRKIGALDPLHQLGGGRIRIFHRCMQARTTSPRLCGGMFVAMPTAMPAEPLTRMFGNWAGRTVGSSRVLS